MATLTSKWKERVKYINNEYPFLPKPGQVVIIRNEIGKISCENSFAFRSYMVVSSYLNGLLHGITADRNGSEHYYYRGVAIPRKYYYSPETLTFEECITHKNAEVRRVGCEIYGFQRMLDEKKFAIVHEDKYGVLLKGPSLTKGTTLADGKSEPLTIVKVLDAAPNPITNIRDEYFLQVPPEMKRAKQAIAWTFYMNEHEYNPVIEA